MAEEKVLKRNVLVYDGNGKLHSLEAGDLVPEELEEFVTNPKLYADPAKAEVFDDPDVPAALKQGVTVLPRGSELRPPPQHGKGSGLDAWKAYLLKVIPDADVSEDDTRDGIIEFLKSEGKLVE